MLKKKLAENHALYIFASVMIFVFIVALSWQCRLGAQVLSYFSITIFLGIMVHQWVNMCLMGPTGVQGHIFLEIYRNSEELKSAIKNKQNTNEIDDIEMVSEIAMDMPSHFMNLLNKKKINYYRYLSAKGCSAILLFSCFYYVNILDVTKQFNGLDVLRSLQASVCTFFTMGSMGTSVHEILFNIAELFIVFLLASLGAGMNRTIDELKTAFGLTNFATPINDKINQPVKNDGLAE